MPPNTSPTAVLKRANAACAARGLAFTPIRQRVLQLLLEHEKGLKAYNLLALIKAEQPGATPPTVYRALDFLTEHHLAHKIERNATFVACTQAGHAAPSLFLVCPQCGAVTELQDKSVMQALCRSLAAAGHRLDDPEVEIAAICPDCRAG
ncbi:MAG: transcriptional repressor [Burkholderiaceae bacterium]|jgi:Fur family zinc uptake transcriptional regulator|nr:transcriptional repressor [Burkholderiaceae bacterium]